jgi:predicted MPP superfamily phosphohydrolase
MKKLMIIFLTTIVFGLSSCSSYATTIEYTDDLPMTIKMKGDTLKILQLTDLHLTYGIDANDRKTFKSIEKLIKSDDFDLIVITGDMTMSIMGPSLFISLIKLMESLKTPWTFVFGNHETDYHNYEDYLRRIHNTEYLKFKIGPMIEAGGYGNFVIEFTKNEHLFYKAYFMDSHSERDSYTEEEGEYGYLSTSQVEWYENHVSQDTVDSVIFMHVPLRQYMNPINYNHSFEEDKVYPQGVDTGMFDRMVQYGKTKGVFVGHDHLNDFDYLLEGILLAYGRISGYNAYGYFERSGRIIWVNSSHQMTSDILLISEVS